jgi:hypothetical protein
VREAAQKHADSAADALGMIGDPRAVEPLVKALGNGNSGLRRSAARALQKITGQEFGRDQQAWTPWLGAQKARPAVGQKN